ncbi:MAG TPA: hypothetical protein PLM63_04105 [bacterium]|nr:hypothetical protein [bacterium]
MKEIEIRLKRLEVILKYELYFIEDKVKQEVAISILKEYCEKLPDSKLKDKVEKIILKYKKDYFELVDFLVKDIIDSKKTEGNLKIIQQLIKKIRKMANKLQKIDNDSPNDNKEYQNDNDESKNGTDNPQNDNDESNNEAQRSYIDSISDLSKWS